LQEHQELQREEAGGSHSGGAEAQRCHQEGLQLPTGARANMPAAGPHQRVQIEQSYCSPEVN